MKIKIDHVKCNRCGICVENCPVEAMGMTGQLTIDETRCTGCRMCLAVCPTKALGGR